MSDSLREQLLKSGLANESDVKRAKAEKHRQQKQQNKRKKGERAPQTSEAARKAKQAAQVKREYDQVLNRERELERKKKADEHAGREMLLKHEIPHNTGKDEIAFNFPQDNRIRKINVSREQHKKLARGELAIGRTRGHFRLLPREAAERVQALAPFLIVYLPEAGPGDDDPAYEEHPIPDDLMW